MSRTKPDDVTQFLDQAGLAADIADTYAKPAFIEMRAANHIRTLLPTLRTWADALSKRDRAGLAMALHVSEQVEILHAAMENKHAASIVGHRVLANIPRMTRPKYNHATIIADARKHLKAGVKPHKLVGVLHTDALKSARHFGCDAIGKRRIRDILKKEGFLNRK